jgi:hypothetical protein
VKHIKDAGELRLVLLLHAAQVRERHLALFAELSFQAGPLFPVFGL